MAGILGQHSGRHFSRQQVVVRRLERSFGWPHGLELISPSQLQPMEAQTYDFSQIAEMHRPSCFLEPACRLSSRAHDRQVRPQIRTSLAL